MGKKSRTKGATFERAVCKAIYEELGVEVRRNLSQFQESGLGDIELEQTLCVRKLVSEIVVGAMQSRSR
jgi:hypothetical protein